MNNQLEIIIEEDEEIEQEELQIEISTKRNENEEVIVEPLETWKYIVMYGITFLLFIALCIYTTLFYESENSNELFIKKIMIYGGYTIVAWTNGKFLRGRLEMKVNYTRKINHVLVWLIPPIVDAIIPVDETFLSALWNIFMGIFGQMLWTLPVRNFDKTGFLNTAFSAMDRPEDRPNTLKWMALQNIGTGLSIFPFSYLFSKWNLNNFLLVPLLIVTFGDGLAEPIGVRFGKHKYKVKALFTDKLYTRSYEGSSCVFFSAIGILGILHNEFETLELILNILLIPIITTLVEAFSPHTLDNPLIITSCAGILALTHLPQEL